MTLSKLNKIGIIELASFDILLTNKLLIEAFTF